MVIEIKFKAAQQKIVSQILKYTKTLVYCYDVHLDRILRGYFVLLFTLWEDLVKRDILFPVSCFLNFN